LIALRKIGGVNARQRKRRQSRRATHAAENRPVDRPGVILALDSYTRVDDAHIVPRMFQRAWETEDRKVAVHEVGSNECTPRSTKKAGTRTAYYRRRRHNGDEIDDIEACLQVVEDKSTKPLRDLISGAAITPEYKAAVAQFLAVQTLRGPAFFKQRADLIEPLLRQLEPKDLKPGVLAAHGGDIERVRARVVQAHFDPTRRYFTMLTKAVKLASIYGLMRWQIITFDEDVLAYSDHPVVLWPGEDDQIAAPPRDQGFGPLAAREVRIPLAPDVALLMNWVDVSDRTGVRLKSEFAGELNAFTVAQADAEWMHKVGSEPTIATGPFEPLSRKTDSRYDGAAMLRSTRRATAAAFMRHQRHRTHVQDVQVVVEIPALGATFPPELSGTRLLAS
jgi:Protein of unknown function (DUF4238)